MTWFRRSVHPEEDLSAYVDGELGERARRAVETHLATCEACSALLRELQDTKSLLSELPRVEPRRSLALGPEFAVPRPIAPAPRRMSLSFAPAVALTLLVGLLFVDAIDSTGGGSSNDAAFDSAGSSSGSTAASRAAEPELGGGLAIEAAKATEEGAADATTDSAANQDGSDTSGDQAPNPAAAASAEAAPTQSGEAGAAASSALAPPSEATPEPDTATAAETAPETPARESFEDDDESAADLPALAPEETSPLAEADGSSGGLSTLRMLEIAAALAFVASLLLAVFLPRIAGREER
jgi:anti-sigma factor RsiW